MTRATHDLFQNETCLRTSVLNFINFDLQHGRATLGKAPVPVHRVVIQPLAPHEVLVGVLIGSHTYFVPNHYLRV